MLIVLIPIIVFLLFLIALIYFIRKDKSKVDIEKVYAKIEKVNSLIKDIGVIQDSDIVVNSNTESNYIKIKSLSRIF